MYIFLFKVECANHKDKLKEINEARQNGKRYDDKIFNELFLRYEAPDSQNRWDSPYFVFSNLLEASFGDIKSAIIDKKPLKPNQSTQSVSLIPVWKNSSLYSQLI